MDWVHDWVHDWFSPFYMDIAGFTYKSPGLKFWKSVYGSGFRVERVKVSKDKNSRMGRHSLP